MVPGKPRIAHTLIANLALAGRAAARCAYFGVVLAVTVSLNGARAQDESLTLPDGPSLAVLPFVNMSVHREQQ